MSFINYFVHKTRQIIFLSHPALISTLGSGVVRVVNIVSGKMAADTMPRCIYCKRARVAVL